MPKLKPHTLSFPFSPIRSPRNHKPPCPALRWSHTAVSTSSYGFNSTSLDGSSCCSVDTSYLAFSSTKPPFVQPDDYHKFSSSNSRGIVADQEVEAIVDVDYRQRRYRITLRSTMGPIDVYLVREMQERLRDLSENDNNHKLLFVTEEDTKGIPCFQNEILIAIKAPHGTTLEVPDPDEDVDYRQRRYGIFLRSRMGPIFVYLVSQFEEKFEEMNGVEQRLSVPLASSSGSNENQVELVNTVSIRKEIEPQNDTDYWLLSDADVSIMDMWKTDYVEGSGVDMLHSDFGMAEVGTPRPETLPSRMTEVSSSDFKSTR